MSEQSSLLDKFNNVGVNSDTRKWLAKQNLQTLQVLDAKFEEMKKEEGLDKKGKESVQFSETVSTAMPSGQIVSATVKKTKEKDEDEEEKKKKLKKVEEAFGSYLNKLAKGELGTDQQQEVTAQSSRSVGATPQLRPSSIK